MLGPLSLAFQLETLDSPNKLEIEHLKLRIEKKGTNSNAFRRRRFGQNGQNGQMNLGRNDPVVRPLCKARLDRFALKNCFNSLSRQRQSLRSGNFAVACSGDSRTDKPENVRFGNPNDSDQSWIIKLGDKCLNSARMHALQWYAFRLAKLIRAASRVQKNAEKNLRKLSKKGEDSTLQLPWQPNYANTASSTGTKSDKWHAIIGRDVCLRCGLPGDCLTDRAFGFGQTFGARNPAP